MKYRRMSVSERVRGRGEKPQLGGHRLYWAYDKDGNNRGQVRLSHKRKLQYEEKGFTFKAVHA